MFRRTITQSKVSIKAFYEGDDVKVEMNGEGVVLKERWFSRHTSIDESFDEAVVRIFARLSFELNSPLLPII